MEEGATQTSICRCGQSLTQGHNMHNQMYTTSPARQSHRICCRNIGAMAGVKACTAACAYADR